MRWKFSRPFFVSRTITLRRSLGSSRRVTRPASVSLSTKPVTAPFETISRRDSSDMVSPSEKRSSWASTSKRAIEVPNSLRRRWPRMLSSFIEQLIMRSQSLSSRWPFSAVAASPFRRLRARGGTGLVIRSVMSNPSDDKGADAGTAADIEYLAGDERRFARREEQHSVGNVLGLAQPLHRDGIGQRRLALAASLDDLVEHVRALDRAGRHHVDRNAEGCELERPGAPHADHSGLGGGISGAALRTERRTRGDQHDAAEACRFHLRQRCGEQR